MLQGYAEDNVLTAVGKPWCGHMVEGSRRHALDDSYFGKVVIREAQEKVEIILLLRSCSRLGPPRTTKEEAKPYTHVTGAQQIWSRVIMVIDTVAFAILGTQGSSFERCRCLSRVRRCGSYGWPGFNIVWHVPAGLCRFAGQRKGRARCIPYG